MSLELRKSTHKFSRIKGHHIYNSLSNNSENYIHTYIHRTRIINGKMLTMVNLGEQYYKKRVMFKNYFKHLELFRNKTK